MVKHKELVFVTIAIIVLLIVSKFSYNHGLKKGWDIGADQVFKATVDTFQTIMNKQLKSDTSITELILENPDTSIYFISRKTLLIK